jgi:hypothetical protein
MLEKLSNVKKLLKGKYDVILSPELVGIASHESCGHPYEADRILGREAAQAGKSFVSKEMLGEKIGSDVVTTAWEKTDMRYLAAGLGGIIPVGELTIRAYEAISTTTTTSTPYTWSNLKVILNSNVTLQTPLVFSGQSEIDGNGYMLTLAQTSSLAVASGGSLLMKDISVVGLRSQYLQGIDGTSTFSFHNVNFVLDSDYTFGQGKFEVLGDFVISGEGRAFIYTSAQASRIRGTTSTGSAPCDRRGFHGRMILDHGVTFSYNTANPNRLVLDDPSAQLIMRSSTLAALNALTLTKGLLLIDGKSYFISTPGITCGDGTTANNLIFELMPAAVLDITGCKLIKKCNL